MKMNYTHDGYSIEITTEHSSSSNGQPVLLSDGRLTETVVEYEPDDCSCTILGMLADVRGIHDGPKTRRQLSRLADDLQLSVLSGTDCDRVIAEFQRRAASPTVLLTKIDVNEPLPFFDAE